MEHRNATTNRHLRRLIQTSPKSIRQLAAELCLSPTTVWKWKHAGRVENLSTRPKTIHRRLTKLEERIVVKVRRHLRLPVSECVQLVAPYFPKLTPATAYRILSRYGLSVLPRPFRSTGKFPQYLPGFFHIDLAYLPVLGSRVTRKYLLVAIDRTTKLIFLMMVPGKHQRYTIDFLRALVAWCPYRIHRILTDNGREFGRKFAAACVVLGIKPKHTKVKHPWTNGQAEITVKLIKQETVWVNFYRDYRHLDGELVKWLNNYNLNRRLKRLEDNTVYQTLKDWRWKKPEIFLKEISKKTLMLRYTMS
jgi:transposase InsO family protein